MDFSDALKIVKAGDRITRTGWNGKDMWLSMTPGAKIPAEKFWSASNRKFAQDQGGEAEVLPYLTMKTADGKIVPWLASHTDILAEDWNHYVETAAAPSGGTRHVAAADAVATAPAAPGAAAPGATRLAAGVAVAAAAKPAAARATSASAGTIAAAKPAKS